MRSYKHRHPFTWLLPALLCALLLAGCGGKKKITDIQGSVEPDKVLFERAQEDIKHGRHTVARLTLQTLINTYPDSEYLAKAKLAIADSYYKEGGTAGLAQAVREYEDFRTFFPFLEEAAYAQMQIALAHYRQMEKPDRDRTQARLAEEALQTFLLKYPDSELRATAEQRLREVQEVLAEGDFRIARFYFIKGSLRAAAARLMEIVERYPLYSQADRALWMLGEAFERVERTEFAAAYYSRVVREYPLSPLAEDAKQKLLALGVPVPQPNPEALARMQKEQEFDRERPGILRRSLGMFKSGPDVSMAARVGEPNLSPPGEPTSPTQVLRPGGDLSIGVVTPGGSFTPAEGNSAASGNSDPKAATGESSTDPKPPLPNKAEEKDKKKKDDAKKKEEKKKPEESSSKKKKGLRKIIPW